MIKVLNVNIVLIHMNMIINMIALANGHSKLERIMKFMIFLVKIVKVLNGLK
jgi:hypothetical protein